jgi:hypothetical protein
MCPSRRSSPSPGRVGSSYLVVSASGLFMPLQGGDQERLFFSYAACFYCLNMPEFTNQCSRRLSPTLKHKVVVESKHTLALLPFIVKRIADLDQEAGEFNMLNTKSTSHWG